MKKIIISTVLFLLAITSFALAENLSSNKELLEEMEVMEAILNQTLGKNAEGVQRIILGTYYYNSARGIYLSDYGMIFDVPYLAYNVGFEGSVDNPDKTYGTIGSSDKPYWKEKKKGKDIVPEIKKSIIKFYTKYASSISELKPHEKLTVIMDLNGLSAFSYPQPSKYPQQIIATLLMSDIEKFKKNKISDDELGKRIKIDEINSVNENISIFLNIIQTSFSNIKEDAGFAYQGDVKNIHIPGHGIVFMLDPDMWIKSKEMMIQEFKNRKKDIKEEMEEMDDYFDFGVNGKKSKYSATAIDFGIKNLKEYEEKLIKVISKYGHTLSILKADEYVKIALIFDRQFISTRTCSESIINIKKSDIDDFHKGKIDFDNFRKRVSVARY